MDLNRAFSLITRLLGIVLSVTVVLSTVASEQGELAVKQVTEESYRYFLGDNQGAEGILYTHVGDNRGLYGAEHDLARDNIAEHLESYGLSVLLEPFQYSGTRYNVVARSTLSVPTTIR
jgi:hypothetical protein